MSVRLLGVDTGHRWDMAGATGTVGRRQEIRGAGTQHEHVMQTSGCRTVDTNIPLYIQPTPDKQYPCDKVRKTKKSSEHEELLKSDGWRQYDAGVNDSELTSSCVQTFLCVMLARISFYVLALVLVARDK